MGAYRSLQTENVLTVKKMQDAAEVVLHQLADEIVGTTRAELQRTYGEARAAEEAAARGVRALVSKSAAATQALHAEVEGGMTAFLGPEPRDYVREAMQQARF